MFHYSVYNSQRKQRHIKIANKYYKNATTCRSLGTTLTNQNYIQQAGSIILYSGNAKNSRSQWPRGLRRRSTPARPLILWVRIPLGSWMSVCCECCVLSGRGLCDGLITRPEKSYRLWHVVVCDQETSKMRSLKPATGLWKIQPQSCNVRKTNKQC